MSWIDKEVKKRVKAAQDSHQPDSSADAGAEAGHMQALWDLLLASNNQLPDEIRLKVLADTATPVLPGTPKFLAWLQAPNSAGLGFTGDAVRYSWPERSRHASHNFWLRWTPEQGYVLVRRLKSSGSVPRLAESRFDPKRADHVLKCLVVGKRVTAWSVAKRRFWLF